MSDLLKKPRKRTKEEAMTGYEEEKNTFEKALAKPSITLTLELPEGFEDLKEDFLGLESDEKFVQRVEKLLRKTLETRKREK